MRKITFLLIILIVLSILHYPQIGIGNNYFPLSATNVASSTPIPELSWTSGHLFPLVNASPIFPTLNPSITPSVDQTHWYAGGIYPNNAPAQNARTIYTSIEVPPSAPRSDRFYYILLSAWDNGGSYNQIGFSDSYGTWGLTYSWTSGPPNNPTYHYSANAMALSSGVTYTFNITVESGVAHFAAYQGSTKVWSLDRQTGGDSLVISSDYNGFGADYTNYEEAYPTSTPGNDPEFDFYFYNNYWVSTDGYSNPTTWATFSPGAPSNVAVIISGSSVYVHNPSPSSISCSVSPNSVAIGSSVNVSGTLSPVLSGVAVNLSYTLPNSSVLNRAVTSAADGSYTDRYASTMLGSWRVKASWNGDTTYDGATSPTLFFTVHHSIALEVPEDYSTIQAAINAAFVGDTISVASGTYNENPDVNISNVTLTGQGSSTTVVNGTFICHASNVRIVNFEIKGEFNLYFAATYVYVSRNTLRTGIRIAASTSTIINNLIYGNVTIIGQQGAASGNIIKNNTLYGGIILQCPTSGMGNNVNYNVITKNTIVNASVGIWEKGNVHADIYPDCFSNNISENWLNKCGIGVELSKNVISPSLSIVSKNTFESCGYGIVLNQVTNVSVFHNNFIDNTVQAWVNESYYNSWDNGYPSGGNYWSNYPGSDLYHGLYQNLTGSDGIGDTPYAIGINNTDRYPFLPFSDEFSSPSLGGRWTWTNQPQSYDMTSKLNWLSVTPTLGTNFWSDVDTGQFLHQWTSTSFIIETRVSSNLTANYQQAGLMVRQDANNWAKTCFEYSDGLTVKTVVNRNNAASAATITTLPAGTTVVWLRMIRNGYSFTTYYSLDGSMWTQQYSWYEPLKGNIMVGLSVTDGTSRVAFQPSFDYFHYGELVATSYSPQFGDSSFPCSIISNSLVSSFTFDQPSKMLKFSITGDSGTSGMCNVTFPTQLLGGQYVVLIDGSPQSATMTSNTTHASVYFTYSQSTHNVEIIGTTAVPEFPTMITNLLVLSVLVLMLLFTSHRSAR